MHSSDWSEDEIKSLTAVRKVELKIAAPYVEPWVMPCHHSTGCVSPGFGIELTNTICNRLRIVCKFVYQNATSSSDFQADLAHAITFGGVDTSLPMLTPTPDLAVNLNFTTTAYFTEDAFMVRTEYVDPTDYLFVMKPFRPIVWVVIILSLVGVVFLDGLCQLAHEIDGRHLNKLDILIRVENSWLYHLGTLLQRSHDKPVFRWSRRFLIIGWGFSTLLLGSTYSAMLVSYRVAPTGHTPYNDLNNLADALIGRKLKLLVFNPDSDFVRHIQQFPINDNYKRFHDALNASPPVYTSNVTFAVNALLSPNNNNVAFYGSLLTLRSISIPNCTLTTVPLGVNRWGAYAFRRYNALPYVGLFTKVILSFQELGYYKEKLEQKYDNGRKCADKVKSAQSSRDVTDVNTVNLLFVFLALICGYGTGVCVLLMEKLGVKCRRHNLLKKQRSNDVVSNVQ